MKPNRLALIRARFYAVASFALTHVLNASRSEVHEEISLARASHERNGTDNLNDGEDIPVLPPSIAEESPRFHVGEGDALLTPKERRELHRATIRAKAQRASSNAVCP